MALAAVVLDQGTKLAVVKGLDLSTRESIDVLPPYLVFHMAWNQGVNFGLFAAETEVARWGLIALAVGISAWVWIWVRREGMGVWGQVAAGFLIGGAMGNVIDRLIWGAVQDFLNMSCCGIENPFSFNLADVAVFVGALGLVVVSALAGGKGKPKPGAGRKTP